MDKQWRMLMGAMLLFAMWPAHASPDYLGEKQCYGCHKDKKRSYLEGVHGKIFTQNARDDIQARGCEACHGPGSEHVKLVGDDNYKGPLKIQSFSKKEPATAQEQNGMCLVCHQGTRRTHWQGSVHELAGLACSSCHSIHNPSKTIDPSVCGTCHMRQRALVQQVSHMPMREGILTCMDCHNPHGGDGPHLLNAPSTNDVCYRCHAEKRGPFIWEHPPAREDCAICHEPHGSSQEALLRITPPFLCQRCHSLAQHPGNIYEGSALAARDMHLVGKACVNCHTQIHGSNHPSGTRWQR